MVKLRTRDRVLIGCACVLGVATLSLGASAAAGVWSSFGEPLAIETASPSPTEVPTASTPSSTPVPTPTYSTTSPVAPPAAHSPTSTPAPPAQTTPSPKPSPTVAPVPSPGPGEHLLTFTVESVLGFTSGVSWGVYTGPWEELERGELAAPQLPWTHHIIVPETWDPTDPHSFFLFGGVGHTATNAVTCSVSLDGAEIARMDPRIDYPRETYYGSVLTSCGPEGVTLH